MKKRVDKTAALKREVRKVVSVIRKGATAVGTMLDKDGNMCIWGGLANYVGVPPNVGQIAPHPKQVRAVNRRFPILCLGHVLSALIQINDECTNISARRKVLIQYINKRAENLV